jgi:hypothetical protein
MLHFKYFSPLFRIAMRNAYTRPHTFDNINTGERTKRYITTLVFLPLGLLVFLHLHEIWFIKLIKISNTSL